MVADAERDYDVDDVDPKKAEAELTANPDDTATGPNPDDAPEAATHETTTGEENEHER